MSDNNAYNLVKTLIKYKMKTKEELIAYCDAYLATKKLTPEQYTELVDIISKL